jgi:hypothetical protein
VRDKDGLRKRLRQWLDDNGIDFCEAVEGAAGYAVGEYVARGGRDDVDGQPTSGGKREEMAGEGRDACGVSIACAE